MELNSTCLTIYSVSIVVPWPSHVELAGKRKPMKPPSKKH
jgi:hypothetical protein